MSTLLTYRFKFNAASQGQLESGALARMTLELWLEDKLLMKSPGWLVRDGKNGPWPASPGYTYNDKEGTKKFGKYVYVWPKVDEGADTSNQYAEFNQLFLQAYESWKRNEGGLSAPGRATAGDSLAPRPPAAPRGPALPPGWQRQFNAQYGKYFLLSPDGKQAVWEDSDEGKRVLASAAVPALPPMPPALPPLPPPPMPIRMEAPAPAPVPDNPFEEVSVNPFIPPIPRRN